MSFNYSRILCSLFYSIFFFLFSSSSAFNITNILDKQSDFSTFNDMLTKTKLADQINSRQTITVLAVDNGAASSLSGMSPDEAKKVLSVHVILDYYDPQKLQKLKEKTTKLTTLFQASGQAVGQQGFLIATITTSGGVAFGSAAAPSGSSPSSNLVKSVASQPFNISVLQVSSAISLSGSGAPSSSPTGSPSNSSKPGSSPVEAPSPRSAADGPSDDADAPSEDSDAPSDAMSPGDADAPSDATSPASSPPEPADAEGPAADGAPAADSPKPSGAPSVAFFGSSFKLGVIFALILCSAWSLSI